MFKILQHLKFLLTATNQHGVHSPFIYNYVTKCVYSKPHYPHSKSVNILLKSIAYFDAKQVWLSENGKLKKKIQNHFTDVKFSAHFSEILYLSASNGEILDTVLSQENNIKDNTVLLIDGIHTSKEKNNIWEGIKIHEKVSVTVDMFHCGAVFFRKEQAKEHFKIRI